MSVDQNLVKKGLRQLAILLILLITSPLLLTLSFKAIKRYSQGIPFLIGCVGIAISFTLLFFTLHYGLKTFKTLLDALFSET